MPLADSLLPYLQRTHGIYITGCFVELPMHLKNTLNKMSLYGFEFSGCRPHFSQKVVKGKIK